MIFVQVAGLLVVSAVLVTALSVVMTAPLGRLGANREAVSAVAGVFLALLYVAVDWAVNGRVDDLWRIAGAWSFGALVAWYGSQLWERWRSQHAGRR